MKTELKSIAAGVMLVSAMGAASQAQASLLIDDFTMYQTVVDTSATAGSTSSVVNPLTGTDLVNANRTIVALATLDGAGTAKEEVIIDGGILDVANSTSSLGTVHLEYNFNAANFSNGASAILLKAIGLDLTASGLQIKFGVNNGAAFTGYQTFTSASEFTQSFAAFSGNADFSNVTNLTLDFQGRTGWDGQFQLLTTNSVPEPATLGLIGLGLAAIGYRKRKQA